VFFHSALIQGIGSGLLAGKLAENNVLAGLKYGIAIVVLSTAVFVVI
jgi:flagellar protein FlaJ